MLKRTQYFLCAFDFVQLTQARAVSDGVSQDQDKETEMTL